MCLVEDHIKISLSKNTEICITFSCVCMCVSASVDNSDTAIATLEKTQRDSAREQNSMHRKKGALICGVCLTPS